jgi:hypothetical protein
MGRQNEEGFQTALSVKGHPGRGRMSHEAECHAPGFGAVRLVGAGTSNSGELAARKLYPPPTTCGTGFA